MNTQPPQDPHHVKSAKLLNFNGLTLAQVRTVCNTNLRLMKSLPDRHPAREHFTQLMLLAHQEEKRRELEIAKKRDKGVEPLWAMCSLRTSYGSHTEHIRYPNYMITRHVYGGYSPSVSESVEPKLQRRRSICSADWDYKYHLADNAKEAERIRNQAKPTNVVKLAEAA